MPVAYPFVIVEFSAVKKGEKPTCAVVPAVWLYDIGDTVEFECYWPTFTTSMKIGKAAERQQVPGDNWQRCRCRILKKFGKCVAVCKLCICLVVLQSFIAQTLL